MVLDKEVFVFCHQRLERKIPQEVIWNYAECADTAKPLDRLSCNLDLKIEVMTPACECLQQRVS
jgi:hypothetical protein